MRHRIFLALGAAAMLTGVVAEAKPGDRIRAKIAERMAAQSRAADANAPAFSPSETIAYGSDALQNLNFYKPQNASGPAPLVLFVHGGGWSKGSKDNGTGKWKAAHYPTAGYAFASINYRLVPQASVEQQAADVASALKALLMRADKLGIDKRRVVIMGHSAGAHLVALVGSDERYLKGAGLSFADLAGVIPIDGAAYDVAAQMQDGNRMMQRSYKDAFGNEPARQRALSPTMQAAAPNAPRFLLLHVQRADGVRQNEALEKALKAAGTAVERQSIPGEGLMGHMEINRRLGDPDYVATGLVDGWLKPVFGG